MPPPEGSSGRRWATEEDWEKQRETISQLYETKTLAELSDIMEKEHGFSATSKMYKTRFRRWGLWKYTRAADVAQVLKAKARQDHLDAQPAEVYLNGKRVDFNRVEKYLRRRGMVRRGSEFGILYVQQQQQQPQESPPSTVVLRIPSSRSKDDGSVEGWFPSSPAAPTASLTPPTELLADETAFRAVRDYYDGCLSANRWFFEAPTNNRVFLAAPDGSLVDGARRLNDFHQRFKLAVGHLETPEQTGPEGVKMARVCFAELPEILAGEDPTLLYCILDIARRLRGLQMHSLARQLLQHLDALAARPGGAQQQQGRRNATAAIWRGLLGADGGAALGDEQTMRCARIVTDLLAAHLGPQHMKAIEAGLWATFLSDGDADAKERRLRETAAAVNALDEFDYRHLFITCDLANLVRKRGKLAEAAAMLVSVLSNPDKDRVLRGYPPIAYNYLSLLGKIRISEGRPADAQGLFQDAITIAKTTRGNDDSDLLDGLFSLEQCLRRLEKYGEADVVLAERNALLRESLERVGEKEDSIS